MTLHYCKPCGQRKVPDILCAACRVVYYCSEECHDVDQVRHRSSCTPSVPLDASSSIHSRLILSSTHQQFEQESILRRGAAKKPPAVLATREITIDPVNFVTVRLRLDQRKHTSIYLSTQMDILWKFPGTDDERWLPPPVTLDLIPENQVVLLIAPGKKMVADLERRRASARGDSPRPITIPDEELIDFGQSIYSEYNKEKRLTIAHVVEWYPWGTMIREDAQLI